MQLCDASCTPHACRIDWLSTRTRLGCNISACTCSLFTSDALRGNPYECTQKYSGCGDSPGSRCHCFSRMTIVDVLSYKKLHSKTYQVRVESCHSKLDVMMIIFSRIVQLPTACRECRSSHHYLVRVSRILLQATDKYHEGVCDTCLPSRQERALFL